MKKILFVCSLALIIASCKKQNETKLPATPDKQAFLIGSWARTSMNDTVFTGNNIDSIQYAKVFIPRILVFDKQSTGFDGFALEGTVTINLSYSGTYPPINVTIQDNPVTTWRLIKVSDTKIRLIRSSGNLSYAHIGYDDEYSKQ